MKYRYHQIAFLLQALGCLLFMSLPLLFLNDSNRSFQQILTAPPYWLFCGSFMLLYWLNAYVLIPNLLVKKHYWRYGFIALLLLGFFYILRPFDRLMRLTNMNNAMPVNTRMPPPFPHQQPFVPDKHRPGMPGGRHFDLATIYIFFMIIALSTAGRVIHYWMVTEKRVGEVEADKVRAELSFLKAQVHPHFLFNTLHNIYALALTNHAETAESIFKLSQLMRYFMEEPQDGEVAVQDEVKAMQDYIGLQRLRWGGNVELEERYEGLERTKTMMPLLFMPFVENAFKYGISKIKESFLFFYVKVTDNQIYFQAKNKIHKSPEIETSGIGVRNTERRLQHFYPGRYDLQIEQENGFFSVTLILDV